MSGDRVSGDRVEASRLTLPPVPAEQRERPVAAWREPVLIDTYEPAPPCPYPMYLDDRVYQGSSGRIYPLPLYERISTAKAPRWWDAIHLENRWLRIMVLPALGGRIHVGYDKTAGYDFFYRQNVIKPALVGLNGPWASGGVEFNWPQHHRPGTFLPVDVAIEPEPDGAVTVWCSDHDPFTRMKGMHGVRLAPDRALLEVRVRLHNRTEDVQTFLWWANAAAHAHDDYQAFFPTDVHVVADHARRATATFPRVSGRYYGIDYPARVDAGHPDADRLDWYRNIPVPTSYMCVGSGGDFLGGYDHAAQAGFVHWADRRVAPGKKQWTWGNSPFGWAWDRNLTDDDGPYVELMAGVYTDNQPDFSWLAPFETRTFSQYWYPIQRIGPAHQATVEAAVSLAVDGGRADGTRARVGVAVTAPRPGSRVHLRDAAGQIVWAAEADLAPDSPLVADVALAGRYAPPELQLAVEHGGTTLVRWRPGPQRVEVRAPEPATEPPAPQDIDSADELYVTGLHLEQYRHATRSPEPYWQEALRRDPHDARCNVALAARRYRTGHYEEAEELLRRALARLTRRNANPYDGEAHYRLGLTLIRLDRSEEAYDALAKAAWNAAWQAPAYVVLARLDCRAARWAAALDHLDRALRVDSEPLQARNLRVLVLRRLGRVEEAEAQLRANRRLDPLDWWARDLAGAPLDCDAQTRLDVALDYVAAGMAAEALPVLARAGRRASEDALEERPSADALEGRPSEDVVEGRACEDVVEGRPSEDVVEGRPSEDALEGRPSADTVEAGAAAMLAYHRADLLAGTGDQRASAAALADARAADPRYCFPARPEDAAVLRRALRRDPTDARAASLLGHWLYDKRRYAEAVAHWLRAVELDPADAVAWRNLGLAAFNVDGDPVRAATCYERALAVAAGDARLWYERDQLARRRRIPPDQRLSDLERRPDIVADRDDLTIEYSLLLVRAGWSERALEVLAGRHFQPWEGAEGGALFAWEQARLALARADLAAGRGEDAERHVRAALDPPYSLGQARHPLAGRAHLLLVLGDAQAAAGDPESARRTWTDAAADGGYPLDVNALPRKELAYFTALAWRRLGREDQVQHVVAELAGYARHLFDTPARLDYFTTSSPAMPLFADDIQARRDNLAAFLNAQAAALRGQRDEALARVDAVLAADPNHLLAAAFQAELSSHGPSGRPLA